MPRRKISMYCVTEQAWKEVKTRGGVTYECPEDPRHTVQSVVDKGAVQESEVLLTVPLVKTGDGVLFNDRDWEAGRNGNLLYFPGTVSLQARPAAVKLLVTGRWAGRTTAFQLREYYSDKVLAAWKGDLFGNERPQILTLEVGDHAANWPAGESILALYGATEDWVWVHTLSIL